MPPPTAIPIMAPVERTGPEAEDGELEVDFGYRVAEELIEDVRFLVIVAA